MNSSEVEERGGERARGQVERSEVERTDSSRARAISSAARARPRPDTLCERQCK